MSFHSISAKKQDQPTCSRNDVPKSSNVLTKSRNGVSKWYNVPMKCSNVLAKSKSDVPKCRKVFVRSRNVGAKNRNVRAVGRKEYQKKEITWLCRRIILFFEIIFCLYFRILKRFSLMESGNETLTAPEEAA